VQEVTFTLRFDEETAARLNEAFGMMARAITQGLEQAARQVQEQVAARQAISEPARTGCMCQTCQAERLAIGYSVPLGLKDGVPTAEQAKASLWQILESPIEAMAVQRELRLGQLEGMDPVRCLIGIIARCRGMAYNDLEVRLGRTDAEHWVMGYMRYGMTPENHARARLLDAWLTEWLEEHRLDLPVEWERVQETIKEAAGFWEELGVPSAWEEPRRPTVEDVFTVLGVPASLIRDEGKDRNARDALGGLAYEWRPRRRPPGFA